MEVQSLPSQPMATSLHDALLTVPWLFTSPGQKHGLLLQVVAILRPSVLRPRFVER
jgi:hypothetical protein